MKAVFQHAIWPITGTAAFFGLALIEYPLGKPRRRLSLVYATVTLSMQIGMYMARVMWPTSVSPLSAKSVIDFMMLCCTIIVLASICLTHWHGKGYHKCMEGFNEVDETLTVLGIETDCSKLRRIGMVSLIMWAIICILLNALNSISYANKYADKRYVFLAFFMYMPMYLCMLVTMQFSSVLGYAGTRFDCISGALRKLTIADNKPACWFRTSGMILVRGAFIPDKRARRIIWTVMHLHFQLCEILRDINTVFETQLCLQFGLDCVFLLSNTIFIFRTVLLPFKGYKFAAVVALCLWTFPYLAEIILTNHLCESVGAKARTVCDEAVQLLRSIDDEEMREDISLMILQAKYRPVRFSCLGLCYFGHHFIYKIFSTVITNAVIILQLKTGLQ